MPVKKNQKIEKKDDSAGIFIPAGLFIGMGIGLYCMAFHRFRRRIHNYGYSKSGKEKIRN